MFTEPHSNIKTENKLSGYIYKRIWSSKKVSHMYFSFFILVHGIFLKEIFQGHS